MIIDEVTYGKARVTIREATEYLATVKGNSPRREPWGKASGRSGSGRSGRAGVQRKDAKAQKRDQRSADSFVRAFLAGFSELADKAVRAPAWLEFLSPLRGLRRLNIQSAADAVGYYRPPLRDFDLARI